MSRDIPAIVNALRNEKSTDLFRRRTIIALSAVGILDFSLISLYQTGIVRRIPDMPLLYYRGIIKLHHASLARINLEVR